MAERYTFYYLSAMLMRQGKLDRVTYVILKWCRRRVASTSDILSAMLMRQGRLDRVAYAMLKLFAENLGALTVYEFD
jgi:hypothetical protein